MTTISNIYKRSRDLISKFYLTPLGSISEIYHATCNIAGTLFSCSGNSYPIQGWDNGYAPCTVIPVTNVYHSSNNQYSKYLVKGIDDFDNSTHESNQNWTLLNFGDTVHISVWFKAENYEQVETTSNGMAVGCDVYGAHCRIWEIHECISGDDNDSFDYPDPAPMDWKKLSISTWQKSEVVFTIPPTNFAHDDYGHYFNDTIYFEGGPYENQHVDGCVPWIGVNWRNSSYGESCPADIWYTDFCMRINP